jgi:hypothetical protein
MTAEVMERPALIRRGRLLEYATIGYNSLEGIIAVSAGLLAGSVALVGFGFDSVIEVISGAALLWRLYADVDESRRELVEQRALRIVGWSLISFHHPSFSPMPSRHNRAHCPFWKRSAPNRRLCRRH